jgi:hypothetical protein
MREHVAILMEENRLLLNREKSAVNQLRENASAAQHSSADVNESRHKASKAQAENNRLIYDLVGRYALSGRFVLHLNPRPLRARSLISPTQPTPYSHLFGHNGRLSFARQWQQCSASVTPVPTSSRKSSVS